MPDQKSGKANCDLDSSSSSSTSLSNMSDAIPVANNKDLLTDESSASNSSSISVTSTNANLTPWLGENRWAIDVNKTSGNTLVVTMFVFQWQIRQGGNGIAQQVSWFYDWAKEVQASKSRPVFYKVDPDVEFPAVMLRTSPTVVYWKKGKEVGRVEGVARPDTWKARANSLTPWTY